MIESMDSCHVRACSAQRELFSLIATADRLELWRDAGARDMAHWLWMRYGLSDWKARRWIACAHALEGLPRISEALASGQLGVDKVVELTRFATPETEVRLLGWAQGVSPGAIRRKGDLALRSSTEETVEIERSRSLTWWYEDEGRRFGMQACLPAAQGAVVARALDRLAGEIPAMPNEDQGFYGVDARRADALVALCSARIASDPDPDRATVIVHASLESLVGGEPRTGSYQPNAEPESGGVIPPETSRRLACNGRIQIVTEDPSGHVVHLGRMRREPPEWMIRQLKHRDAECRFPGCGARRFTHAHHIVWWDKGGRTDLDNLVLICSFHHRLVHEHGWSLIRKRDGTVRWFLPDGTRYRAGPAPPRFGPPRTLDEGKPVLSAVAF